MRSRFRVRALDGERLEIIGMEEPHGDVGIPGRIDGKQVVSIASHAFADQPEIREIRLPGTVERIGSYAFYHCVSLRRLRLTDSVEDLRDGVIRMCPSLDLIEIDMHRGNYRLLKELIGDSEAELHVRLRMEDGEAQLTFPGYFREIREDTRARAIHSTIVGAGYAYRECVTRSGILYEAYDASITRVAPADPVLAGRIAAERLLRPLHLTEAARARYEEHLREYAPEVLPELIGNRDAEGVRLLLGLAEVPRETLDAGILQASALQESGMCGLLMDAMERLYAPSREMETFSL